MYCIQYIGLLMCPSMLVAGMGFVWRLSGDRIQGRDMASRMGSLLLHISVNCRISQMYHKMQFFATKKVKSRGFLPVLFFFFFCQSNSHARLSHIHKPLQSLVLFLSLSHTHSASSHEPCLFLLVELLCPPPGELQVVLRLVWLVIQIQPGHRLFWHSHLDLRALVPLVERRYRDDLGPHVQRRLQGRLVVAAVDAVARVVVVPRSDRGVDVARPGARYK